MTDPAPVPAWRTWLQLLRAPNLFTVPGDPLAGFLLATGGRLDDHLPMVIGASLCLYSHGLLINDLADLAEDRRERPKRPLPSGAASVRTVLLVAVLLALIALGLCLAISRYTFFVGILLLAAILIYNLWSKKIPILGPLNMGLCRGLSVILGAIGGIWEAHSGAYTVWSARLPFAFFAAFGVTLVIAAITHLARIETQANPPARPRALPFYVLIAVVVSFFIAAIDRSQPLRSANIWLYVVSAYTLYAGYRIHQRLLREPPPPIPPIIGQLIRLLLPLQAIFCIASQSTSGARAATLLILLWPISRSVSRRFYAS